MNSILCRVKERAFAVRSERLGTIVCFPGLPRGTQERKSLEKTLLVRVHHMARMSPWPPTVGTTPVSNQRHLELSWTHLLVEFRPLACKGWQV
jgi:hypothetical protein